MGYFYSLLGLAAFLAIGLVWRRLHPKPYPGIPYNKQSARRLLGDLPDLVPVMKTTHENTKSVLEVTTQKLRTPLAQMLFPGIRKPLIVLEDYRETEDILLRRNREFDKATSTVDLLSPMFPLGTISMFTTPELKAQKRLWADVMRSEFLHNTVAPNSYPFVLELIELWKLKASGNGHQKQPFRIMEDLHNLTLDSIWVSLVGERLGVTRHELNRLQKSQMMSTPGGGEDTDSSYSLPPSSSSSSIPRGARLKAEADYIGQVMSQMGMSPLAKWILPLQKLTPRHRQFRRVVTTEIGIAMDKAVKRFSKLQDMDPEEEVGKKKSCKEEDTGEEFDTCMMDLVLRRKILKARKDKTTVIKDPREDQNMLDELFVMLVGGYETTATAITWFVRFMDRNPESQSKLRRELVRSLGLVHFSSSFSEEEEEEEEERNEKQQQQQPAIQAVLQADIPYLDATVAEVLRLAAVGSGNLREATVDTQIMGYPVPKGAEVLMSFHVSREVPSGGQDDILKEEEPGKREKERERDKTFAWRDLGEFEPGRWLVKEEKEKEDREEGRKEEEEEERFRYNPNALPFLPFGGGSRGCYGRKLAFMQLRTVMALLVLNFEFLELPEDMRSLTATEKITRQPDMPYAMLRVL